MCVGRKMQNRPRAVSGSGLGMFLDNEVREEFGKQMSDGSNGQHLHKWSVVCSLSRCASE